MALDTVLSRLGHVRRSGSGWTARCPAHDDQHASLSVAAAPDGRVLVRCFAGCGVSDILRAIGLDWSALFDASNGRPRSASPGPNGRASTPGDPLTWWASHCGIEPGFVRSLPIEADGNRLAFMFVGQRVRKLRTVGDKDFQWGPAGTPTPPLWPLPPEALPEEIYLAEGESDTCILRYCGLPAYSVTRGAGGGLKPAEAEALRHRGVREAVLIFDCDQAGREGARKLAETLASAGITVRCIDLNHAGLVDPLAGFKDIRDVWLSSDRDPVRFRERLETLAGQAEPVEPEIVALDGGQQRRRPDRPSDDDAGKRERQSKSSALIGLALAEAEFWHTPDGTAYATIRVGGVRQHWPLRSRTFAQWLGRRYYETTARDDKPGQAASRDDLAAAVMTLEGVARFDGAEHEVYVRVAPDGEGGVYIDLGDDRWCAVHVAPDGWEIVADPPVRFRRSPGMRPLPVPERGGSLDELRELVNVPDDRAWALLKAWLMAALAPTGPYPLLAIRGEQGAAKSTTARIIRALVDPATPDLRAEPRELRDLMIAARGGWLVAFDNVSRLETWLSDALCRLATGGGFATRELYTDVDEVLFEATRPVVVTSIVTVTTRPDLADRCVSLDLPAIPEDRRRTEAEVWRAFGACRARVFGALLDRLAGALRERDHVRLDRLPRMADFAVLAVAAEQAAGEPPTFLAAYAAVRTEADDDAIDASAIGPALRALLAKHPTWQGTAAELLARLGEIAGEQATRAKGWPKTARGLSGELRRLAPALRRALAVEVEFGGRAPTKKAERLIRIAPRDLGGQSSESSESSERQQASTDAAKSSDGRNRQPSDVSLDRQNHGASDDWPPASDGLATQPSENLPDGHKGSDGSDGPDGSPPITQGGDEAARRRLLALAEAANWPAVPLRPWITIVPTETGWRTFARTASADDIRVALQALAALAGGVNDQAASDEVWWDEEAP